MIDTSLLFLEKIAASMTGRKKLYGEVDQSNLSDMQRSLIKRYKVSLMMLTGGIILGLAVPNTFIIGTTIAVIGWRSGKKLDKLLEAELQPFLKDIPAATTAATSPIPTNIKAGKGPWIVYAWDNFSSKENIFGQFETQEAADKNAQSMQKLLDRNKAQSGQRVSVRYEPSASKNES